MLSVVVRTNTPKLEGSCKELAAVSNRCKALRRTDAFSKSNASTATPMTTRAQYERCCSCSSNSLMPLFKSSASRRISSNDACAAPSKLATACRLDFDTDTLRLGSSPHLSFSMVSTWFMKTKAAWFIRSRASGQTSARSLSADERSDRATASSSRSATRNCSRRWQHVVAAAMPGAPSPSGLSASRSNNNELFCSDNEAMVEAPRILQVASW
mmetsp:Transcript_38705/g.119379  ORF Transcript_38705/g.119379 Transcript_38705/m.119379 type:complete len:213 (+) Transcript_38705:206-844(+)